MKQHFSVHIDGFGWSVVEAESAIALQEELSKKYPKKKISVKLVKSPSLSDTEIAAQEKES